MKSISISRSKVFDILKLILFVNLFVKALFAKSTGLLTVNSHESLLILTNVFVCFDPEGTGVLLVDTGSRGIVLKLIP